MHFPHAGSILHEKSVLARDRRKRNNDKTKLHASPSHHSPSKRRSRFSKGCKHDPNIKNRTKIARQRQNDISWCTMLESLSSSFSSSCSSPLLPQPASSSTTTATLYAPLPQFDLEMQTSAGKAIQSITVSKITNADGSVIKRKETKLEDGQILIEEQTLSEPLTRDTKGLQSMNIRWIPTTINATPLEVLPLTTTSIEYQEKHQRDRVTRTVGIILLSSVGIILLFLTIARWILYILQQQETWHQIQITNSH